MIATPSRLFAIVATLAATALASAALASAALAAQPTPKQLGFQPAATPIMERIDSLHDFVLIVIAVISLFVLGLLAWCMFRYRAAANPTPSQTSHNTPLEIAWTLIPAVILVVIAFPSLSLLYAQHTIPKPDIVIKAIGNQWYWSYEYLDPDLSDIVFDSFMLEDEERNENQPRLLAVDYPLVVPVGKNVQLLVISNDVLHSWTVPAFGVKMDAVPGQLAQTWFRVSRPGTYYGQCSELCGSRHAFMPIEVLALEQDEFERWTQDAIEEFARNDPVYDPQRPQLAELKDAQTKPANP